MFETLARDYAHISGEVATLDEKLLALHRQNEVSQRPAVGPVGATLLAIKVPDAHGFKSGRDFAAWLGLTPKNHSTAGRNRLGVITRAGDEMLRRRSAQSGLKALRLYVQGLDRPPSPTRPFQDR